LWLAWVVVMGEDAVMEWRETSEEAKREIQVFRRHQGLREILHWHWRQALRGAGLAVKETGFFLSRFDLPPLAQDGRDGRVISDAMEFFTYRSLFLHAEIFRPKLFCRWVERRDGGEASHLGFGSSMEITARTGKDSRYIGRGWDAEKNISAGRNYDGFFSFFPFFLSGVFRRHRGMVLDGFLSSWSAPPFRGFHPPCQSGSHRYSSAVSGVRSGSTKLHGMLTLGGGFLVIARLPRGFWGSSEGDRAFWDGGELLFSSSGVCCWVRLGIDGMVSGWG